MPALRFVVHPIRFGDRIYRITPDEVRYVLNRLPREVWGFVRTIHFRDAKGRHGCLGYASPEDSSLTLTALPLRVSFAPYCYRQECRPEEFGATFGRQWPDLAVRRFLLYYVLLHELGHLQRIPSGKMPGERMAREFGHYWRKQLWSHPFAKSKDPVHTPPPLNEQLPKAPSADWLLNRDRPSEAREVLLSNPQLEDPGWRGKLAQSYSETGDWASALEHYPHSPLDADLLFDWGYCHFRLRNWGQAAELWQRSLELQPDSDVARWLESAQKRLRAK